MNKRFAKSRDMTRLDQARGFVAGVLIGLSIWTPVFAANTDQPQDWLPYAILGAIALLVLGVAFKAVASKRAQPYRLPRRMRTPAGTTSGEAVNTGGA